MSRQKDCQSVAKSGLARTSIVGKDLCHRRIFNVGMSGLPDNVILSVQREDGETRNLGD
jgi:hypothetical protein